MRTYENECVSCQLSCLHSSCPYYNVERFYCDKCGNEEVLYEYDGQELCADCVLNQLNIVEGSEYYY